jgi:1-acyl-sn-glycerol-3-phosphate acyltransferase
MQKYIRFAGFMPNKSLVVLKAICNTRFSPANLVIFAADMQHVARLLRFLFTLYGFILFTLFLLLIFPLVIVASFFGRIRGGNFIYILCQIWADVVLFLTFIRIQYIYETKPQKGQPYVFIFNHLSYLDIPLIMKACRGRHFRVLGKAEMTKIPIFGFLYRNAVVLVDRTSAAARAKSVLQLKAVLRKDISVVISPEGTFNMTNEPLKSFYDGAFRIAIETQTPVLPMLFLDAYHRHNYKSVFSLTPGRSRIVYLDPVPVAELTLNDVQALKEKVYAIMDAKLREYNAAWINTANES